MSLLPILFILYVALMVYCARKALELAKMQNYIPYGDHL